MSGSMSETPEKKTYERRRTVLPVAGKADCVNFNIVVVGETGSGKTTFLKTLVKAEEAKAPLVNLEADLTKKTVSIQESGNFLLESIAGDVKFYLYDTPGYGDFVNNEESIGQIYADLQQRHENWLSVDAHKITNEERLRMDTRIHCCFYFIAPHRFKAVDREFIYRISEIVPIVPVISKADAMTMEERAAYLTEVRQALVEIAEKREMHVDDLIYDFQETDQPVEGSDVSGDPSALVKTMLPRAVNIFAIICDLKYEREYPWGTADVKKDEHSDFSRLQKLVFEAGLHIKGLRDMTQRKTIDFLDNRTAYRAHQEQIVLEKQQKAEARVYQERRLGDLEAQVKELGYSLEQSRMQLSIQSEKAASAIASLEEQVRAEKEAKVAAVAEAKARAEDERKLTDSLLKTKEELHVANNHIAKLRSERDAEIRKAVAAATPPPLPSGMPSLPPSIMAPPPTPPSGYPSGPGTGPKPSPGSASPGMSPSSFIGSKR